MEDYRHAGQNHSENRNLGVGLSRLISRLNHLLPNTTTMQSEPTDFPDGQIFALVLFQCNREAWMWLQLNISQGVSPKQRVKQAHWMLNLTIWIQNLTIVSLWTDELEFLSIYSIRISTMRQGIFYSSILLLLKEHSHKNKYIIIITNLELFFLFYIFL